MRLPHASLPLSAFDRQHAALNPPAARGLRPARDPCSGGRGGCHSEALWLSADAVR